MVETHPDRFDLRDQRSGVTAPEQLERPTNVDVSESGADGRLIVSSGRVAARHGSLTVGANWKGAKYVFVESDGTMSVTSSKVGRGQVYIPSPMVR